jgi:hypothetical protein
MQHKSRLVVAIVLMLALVNPAQAATPKAGAKCTKAGTTATASGKKFTCIKSGTKLVWNKGVAIKAAPKPSPNPVFTPAEPTPTPTPAPTLIPTPTPTPIATPPSKSISQRWNDLNPAAMTVFNEWGTKPLAGSHQIKFEFVLSDKADRAAAEEVKKRYDLSARFWAPYSTVTNEIKVLVANHNEAKWICDYKRSWLQIRQDDCEEVEGNGRPDIPTAGQSQVRNRNIDMYMIKNLAEMDTRFFFGRVEHEFTHNIFYHQSQRYQQFMPCWQIEGGAEFFGILMAGRGDPDWYVQARNIKFETQWLQLNEQNWKLDDWVSFLNEIDRTEVPNRQGDPCLPVRPKIYAHSVLANEFLVQKVGISGYLNLIKEADQLTWAGAIKKVFGVDKQTFYRDIAQYMMDQFRVVQENRWSFQEFFKVPLGR